MSELLEFSERMASFAKRAKVDFCHKIGKVDDLAPMIIPAREYDPIAVIHVNKHDPRLMLTTSHIAAIGYDADQLGMIMEGYVAPSSTTASGQVINPLTNEPFKPGEMHDLAVNQDGLARGLVYEAVMLIVLDRSGEYIWRSFPFRADTIGSNITWVDLGPDTDEGCENSIVENMQKIIRREIASPPLPASWENSSRESRDVQMSAGIAQQGHLVAMWETVQMVAQMQSVVRSDFMNPN